MNFEIVKRITEENYDYMKLIRRYFHQNPELSEKEYNTQKYIMEALQKEGVEHIKIADTGVMGIIRGKKEGKVVAVRADMDALPIEEKNQEVYRSTVPGIMHACGHDAHMSMLLGATRVLNSLKEQFDGVVKLLFQPAEETVGGAKRMVDEGCMENPLVDYTIGLHVMPYLPYDHVELRHGCLNASTDGIRLIFKGKSGHAAYPDQGIDAIVMAAHAITNMQILISRNLSPLNPAVLSFGVIHGGEKANIIAERVEVKGTLRTIDMNTRRYMKKRIHDIAVYTAEMMMGECEVFIEEGYPCVINDSHVIQVIEKSIKEALPEVKILYKDMPSLGGEDFSFFAEKSKSAFFSIGCKRDDRQDYSLHSPIFDIDERCMITGAAAQVNTILNLLNEK